MGWEGIHLYQFVIPTMRSRLRITIRRPPLTSKCTLTYFL
ncbi:hypothetical protein [Mesorhizobium sp.]